MNTTQPITHTETPWSVQNHNEIVADNEHETFIAEVFDETDTWQSNARFIVKAVNNYDRLVEMLTRTSKFISSVLREQEGADTLLSDLEMLTRTSKFISEGSVLREQADTLLSDLRKE